jgi:Spy/CpxP family protein refolding chaperone
MKHSVFTTGLAFALSLATAGAAIAQAPTQSGAQRVERADGGRSGPGARGGRDEELFRGITLSANQQTSLKALRDQQRKEFEAQRGNRQAGQAAGGGRGAVRDSASMAARRTQMEARRNKQFASLRSILTADQRVQFDKNVAELKTRGPQGGGFGGRRGGRDGSQKGAGQ